MRVESKRHTNAHRPLTPHSPTGVLRRLLKAHPDLSSEADGIARSLLHQVEYEDIAAEIENAIRALD